MRQSALDSLSRRLGFVVLYTYDKRVRISFAHILTPQLLRPFIMRPLPHTIRLHIAATRPIKGLRDDPWPRGERVRGAETERPLVHIIDDDEVVRSAALFLLESASIKSCTYASAIEFLGVRPLPSEGCIVTDFRMPEMSGLDLLKRLQAEGHDVPVIVMTADVDILLAAEVIRAGAFDLIEKPCEESILISAVRAALGSPDALQADLALRVETLGKFSTLTTRERAVLNRIVAGRSNKEIARDLALSARTVAGHRANIVSKLDASSLSDVIRKTLIAEGTRRFRSK